MKDYKNYGYPNKHDAKVVFWSLVCTILLMIGVVAVVRYDNEPIVPATVRPETIRMHTTQQLAEQSFLINEEMKRRAQGIK